MWKAIRIILTHILLCHVIRLLRFLSCEMTTEAGDHLVVEAECTRTSVFRVFVTTRNWARLIPYSKKKRTSYNNNFLVINVPDQSLREKYKADLSPMNCDVISQSERFQNNKKGKKKSWWNDYLFAIISEATML